MIRTVAVAAGLLLTSPAAAQPADPLREAAAKASHSITLGADGTAAGPGWDMLVEETADAQFVLLGEQHAIADIARLAAALHKALVPHGYAFAAYEVGPYSTEAAEAMLRRGDGAFEARVAREGGRLLFPFLTLSEEAALARQIIALSPHKTHVLWGLDQEFIGAAPLVAELLAPLAKTAAQKAAVAAFAADAASTPFLLGDGPVTNFDALRSAFAGHGEAVEIIDAMILSNQIYAPFTDRGGAVHTANSLRETYMKSNFVLHFAAAEKSTGKSPKVFMKFGGNHMMRGLSTTDVPSLGNFIAEWGHARGLKAVNVLIDCVGGFQRDFQSGEAVACETEAAKPGTLLGDTVAKTGITLVDLRPLRALVRRKSDIDAETRRTIFAFDFYVAIANPAAATFIK